MTPEMAAAELGCEIKITVQPDGHVTAAASGVMGCGAPSTHEAVRGLLANKKCADAEQQARMAIERLSYGIQYRDFDLAERQQLFDTASRALLELGRLAGVRTW